jgi:hypothetical protein
MTSPSGDPSGSDSSGGDSSNENLPGGNGPNENASGPNPPSNGGPGGPPAGGSPTGPDGSLRLGGDGPARVTLSEAAEATEQVLESSRRELQLLRRWLRGEDADMGEGAGRGQGAGEYSAGEASDEQEGGGQEGRAPRLRPGEKARSVAERLEACAGALRNASAPRDP